MGKKVLVTIAFIWLFSLSAYVLSEDTTSGLNSTTAMIYSGINERYFSDGQRFFLYAPESVLANPEEAYILAAIHGYSGAKDDDEGIRVVENTILRWTKLAEEFGWVVLSPHFDEGRFSSDYQRLNFSGTGVRADIRLNELIQETERLIPGINSRKIYLFGFSGGGQFVHRYAAFHPDRIIRAVAAGAGWYLWPDELFYYPVGLNMLSYQTDPNIDDLLSANLLVLVGEDDFSDSAFRETYFIYDLSGMQGDSRRARAENWVNVLRQIAESDDIDFNIELMFAENTGHTVSPELQDIAAEYLTADSAPIALPPWDVNKDGKTDALDLNLVGQSFGENIETPVEPNPDVNGDGTVNILDLILVGRHFTRF